MTPLARVHFNTKSSLFPSVDVTEVSWECDTDGNYTCTLRGHPTSYVWVEAWPLLQLADEIEELGDPRADMLRELLTGIKKAPQPMID